MTEPKKSNRKYSDEQVEVFCNHIADGKSLQETAELYGMTRYALYQLLNRRHQERYMSALNERAMRHAEHIEYLAKECEQGRIDPRAADVSIRARMWICSKYHPEFLAERTKKDVNVEHSMRQEHLNTMKKIAKRRAEINHKGTEGS
jgi:3-methyladenine DNA glycosylase AlkC